MCILYRVMSLNLVSRETHTFNNSEKKKFFQFILNNSRTKMEHIQLPSFIRFQIIFLSKRSDYSY